jgi:hypothetical protein
MTTLSVFVTSLLDEATSETYTLRVGTSFDETLAISDLSDRLLACTINPLTRSCSAVGTVPVVVGELFDLRLDIIGTAPGLHHAIVALTCE